MSDDADTAYASKNNGKTSVLGSKLYDVEDDQTDRQAKCHAAKLSWAVARGGGPTATAMPPVPLKARIFEFRVLYRPASLFRQT